MKKPDYDRAKSLRTQLKSLPPNDGSIASSLGQSQSACALMADDVKFSLREMPVGVLLTLYPLIIAMVFDTYPGTQFFLLPLTLSMFTLCLLSCCGFPWKVSLFFCQPALLLVSFLTAFVAFPKKADGTFFPQNNSTSGLFQEYVKQTSTSVSIYSFVGIFLFSIPTFFFRKRIPTTTIVAVSLWSSLSCFLMGCGILLFQWFFLSSELTGIQEFLIVGLAYPVFGASIGRVLVADCFATLNALLWCEAPAVQIWDSTQAIHCRMVWITFNRIMLGFAGTISLINLESNHAFALSIFTANAVEILFTFG